MAARRELLSKARPVLAAMLCLLLTAACNAGSAAYDPAPWLSDYAVLKHGLETSYANLAWFASPQGGVDLAALDRRTSVALASARSDREAKAALMAFVKAIPDAHLQVMDPKTAAELTALDGPNHGLFDRVIGGPCSDYDLADGLKTDFSLPFDRAGVRRLPQGESPFAYGLYEPPGSPRIGLVRIPSFELRQYPELCRGAAAQQKLGGEYANLDLDDFVQAGFLAFLAQTLADLERRGAKAVIVDLGSNPGGGETGQLSSGLFAAAPLRSNRIWMVAGPPAADLFEHQLKVLQAARRRAGADARAIHDLDAAIAAVGARKAAIPGRACDMRWVWREQRPWAPSACSNLVDGGFMAGPEAVVDANAYSNPATAVALYSPASLGGMKGAWHGPVYVVTDEATASAAELFGAILQDNHAGTVVGRRTIGAGCGNQGPYRFVTLQRTRASIRVSDCVLVRADGADEVAGLRPDIPVTAEEPRARAEETLARVVADLARPQTAPDARRSVGSESAAKGARSRRVDPPS